jgi:hypothetical protein
MKKILTALVFILISASVQASRVDWEILFYNGDGVQVGNGDFSYDPDTNDQFEFNGDSHSFDQTVYINETNTAFTSFNVTVLGEQWTGTYEHWWDGSIIRDRYGNSSYPGDFHLGGEMVYLDLSFNSPSPVGLTTSTGGWFQRGSSLDELTTGGGDWVANRTSVVPIPSVFLLFGSGLVSMLMLGRKSVSIDLITKN